MVSSISRANGGWVRDRIVANAVTVNYYLFDTCLVSFDKFDKRLYFFIPASSLGITSLTTRNRLNGILDSVGFEHRIAQRNYRLYIGDREIDVGKKYVIESGCDFSEVK